MLPSLLRVCQSVLVDAAILLVVGNPEVGEAQRAAQLPQPAVKLVGRAALLDAAQAVRDKTLTICTAP